MKSAFRNDLLDGKVCLITGGSRGGMLKEIAVQFIAHGAKAVVLMSRNKERNEEVANSVGSACHSIPGDVTKRDDCQRVVAEAVKRFGTVDILVNGAAGNFLATADKVSTNGVKKVLDIDTVGTFNMSQ